MKTINVTEATFEDFKKTKIQLQALLGEEMSDSFAMSEIIARLRAFQPDVFKGA
jgi:hypothetical protein